MPDAVVTAKDATVFSVGGAGDYLGVFKTVEFTITQDFIEHSGPRDDMTYVTPRRLNLTGRATGFVPSGGNDIDELIYPPSSTSFTLTADLAAWGKTLTGTFFLTELGSSQGDDAEEESWGLRVNGSWDLT